MKKLAIIALSALVITSCSKQDEPDPEVYLQVSEITNGANHYKKFTYDDYGRVIKYIDSYSDETITVTYSYPSEYKILSHTECRWSVPSWDGVGMREALREYDDEIVVDKGRIVSCEGIYSTNELSESDLFRKKYRHKFTYTEDNHLNVVKCTEWSRLGDSWAYDKPWTWENYYLWENGNLTEVQDCAGNTTPVYTYKYSYSTVIGINNVVGIHFDRPQYYPLMLKGYFGPMSKNLISGIERIKAGEESLVWQYDYIISDNIITSFTEIINGVSDTYNVLWTE